ncbi:arylamine N-acetyltransferase [Thalassobacillus sp. CUG 92003]|uniref:arylamine N-acetyltransferase family protein n=1 Tax=Thalassobacillus sp. CUG 92003 TaxID=2736641 RepID=UPI0015E67AA7|nr:arylamine N-acetyltransferase [Thalassobacillus sp. CUG 92003]
MNHFTKDFYKRIQYQGNQNVQFDDLPELMFEFAKNVPFENLDIIQRQDFEINVDNLKRKIINQYRGGLCYELNPVFYYFLQELGFEVQMISATVSGNDPGLNGTHLAIVLTKSREQFLIDVGFGSHLALQPVPFTGAFVTSLTGKYRIKSEKTEMGEYVLEKYHYGNLETSYSFFLKPVDESYLNYMKDVVTTHPASPFNKSLLLTKVTDNGHITLTDQTYTIMKKGSKSKESIDSERLKQLSASQFGIEMENI